MATISPFTTYTPKSLTFTSNNSFSLIPGNPVLHFQPNKTKTLHCSSHRLNTLKIDNFFSLKTTIVKSSEEENPITEEQQQQQQQEVAVEEEEQVVEEGTAEQQQTVSVPVSPSDTLTMFFQAEGTMNEATLPAVTNALEQTEGVTNLKVQILEGIASVELMKQTTIQATGVASSLVEAIQGAGFKLQTLNLSFEDEEEVLV